MTVIFSERRQQMEQIEILKDVKQDRLKRWLFLAGPPLLRKPYYFEEMGFPSWFVRQFYKKHKSVLRHDGEVQRGVRGVSGIDFLWGLAEAIGADIADAKRTPSEWKRIRLCVGACIKTLEQIDEMSSVSISKACY